MWYRNPSGKKRLIHYVPPEPWHGLRGRSVCGVTLLDEELSDPPPNGLSRREVQLLGYCRTCYEESQG